MKKLLIFNILLLIFFIGYTVVKSDDKKTTTAPTDKNEDIMNNMNYKTATFGGGCFWGIESVFQELEGVVETSVGFMGGTTDNPTYKEVCYENTNHAEVVHLKYDPNKISYTDLLSVFFSIHNPTTLNRQGPDVGSQYRSVIFYHDEDQRMRALDALEQIDENDFFKNPVVTEITPAGKYFIAEDYHQDYYKSKGIAPHCGFGTVNVTLKEPSTK